MVEQGREDGQQCHGDVVDALGDALHLGAGLHELAQLQHLQQLLQVFGRVLEEGPEAGFDQLRAGLHDRPGRPNNEICARRRGRELSWAEGAPKTRAYLVSSECVRMCRQLTIIAESLPGGREGGGVGRKG